MNTDEIEAQLLQFICDECGAPEGLGGDDLLFSSSTLDSLDIVTLIAFIDQRFGVRIPPLDVGFEKMDSAALIAEMVVQYQKA